MVAAIGIWSVVIEPGKSTQFTADCDIRLTTAALGEKLDDESSRSTIKLTYLKPTTLDDDSDEDEEVERSKEDEESPITTTVLCSLTPGKIEQTTLDLVLEEDEEYEIENTGKNTVYLTGNYIDQRPIPFNDGDESDLDDEEGAYDLREVSSDVEINPDELEIPSHDEDDLHRFGGIKDQEVPASKKRGRDSNAMEVEADEKVSKKEKKKSKKQKGENGEPVPTGPEASEPEPKVKLESKAAGANGDAKGEVKKEKRRLATTELAGGLKIADAKTGNGETAKKGDTVSMRYIGKFEDGKVFDSNTKGKPFSFRLGAGEVIKGWDEGIVGMKAGGERLLTVPPKLGYGNRKIDGIPAGSTLRFECKLLSIK